MAQEYAGVVKKDPNAKRWYGIDLSADIGTADVTALEWTVPAGLTKEAQQIFGKQILVKLSGGTAGTNYVVTCHYTLSTGDEDDATLLVRCVEM